MINNQQNNKSIEYLKEYIKQMTDIESLLISLGFEIYRNTESELRGCCAIHGGDNPTGFMLKKQSKRFYCFTKQCHLNEDGTADNDIIALVQKTKKCSFMEALNYLASFCGITILDDGASLDEQKVAKILTEKEQSSFINMCDYEYNDLENFGGLDFVLEAYSRGSDYFKNLGISDYIIDRYMLGTYTDKRGIERASVPIWNEDGVLIGCSGRVAREDYEEKKIPKYDISYGLKKGNILYNLNFTNDENNLIIIVEGFKALWSLIEKGYENVVAVMGSAITEDQILLLLKRNISKVLLFLDWNDAGIKGTDKSLNILNKYFIESLVIPPMKEYFSGAEQPDDLSKEQINEIFSLYL